MNEQLTRYLQRQMLLGEQIMRSKARDSRGRSLRTRNAIVKLQQYVREFVSNKPNAPRWIILPGLRGTGKTTLLAQLYGQLAANPSKLNLLYVSLDEVVEKVGSNLSDLLDEYERLLPISSFEELDAPTFIFIDEVQVDPAWARTIKFVYDRNPKIFFVCSGSSAVHLQTDADVDGRRAVTEKLYPLSFPENQVLARDVLPTKGLKASLMQTLYNGRNARQVYENLSGMKNAVDREWTSYNRGDVNKYLKTGTLPFTLPMSDTRLVYSSISSMVDKIITLDLQSLKQFKSETIGSMKRLIFVLSDCDAVSLDKLAKLVGVSKQQVVNMIDALIKAELIIKVPAHGNNITATTNPSKFLFMSPAIRAAFHDIVGLPETARKREGNLLEDAAGLHYYREFVSRKIGSISHPFDKEGGFCDFILRVDDKLQIPIEFGLGTKGYSQVEETLKRFGGNYGLVFSTSPLGINEAEGVVTVPLDYFFLM